MNISDAIKAEDAKDILYQDDDAALIERISNNHQCFAVIYRARKKFRVVPFFNKDYTPLAIKCAKDGGARNLTGLIAFMEIADES